MPPGRHGDAVLYHLGFASQKACSGDGVRRKERGQNWQVGKVRGFWTVW